MKILTFVFLMLFSVCSYSIGLPPPDPCTDCDYFPVTETTTTKIHTDDLKLFYTLVLSIFLCRMFASGFQTGSQWQ